MYLLGLRNCFLVASSIFHYAFPDVFNYNTYISLFILNSIQKP